jgi:hypothetical protein
VDTDEKKAELFREGLSLSLQDRLVLFHDRSFNTLVSATIDQEDTYRTYFDVEEKNGKRVMPGPSQDSTGVLHRSTA